MRQSNASWEGSDLQIEGGSWEQMPGSRWEQHVNESCSKVGGGQEEEVEIQARDCERVRGCALDRCV